VKNPKRSRRKYTQFLLPRSNPDVQICVPFLYSALASPSSVYARSYFLHRHIRLAPSPVCRSSSPSPSPLVWIAHPLPSSCSCCWEAAILFSLASSSSSSAFVAAVKQTFFYFPPAMAKPFQQPETAVASFLLLVHFKECKAEMPQSFPTV